MPRVFIYNFCIVFAFCLSACSNNQKTEQKSEETTSSAATPSATDSAKSDSATAKKEDPEAAAPEKQKVERMAEYTTSRKYVSFSAQDFNAWKKAIPEIQDIKVTSTKDEKQEPALFYNSGSEKKKPLLVVLHSWSDEYLQQASIPFCLWAKKYDWVFIQPNYRGIFQTPEAMGRRKKRETDWVYKMKVPSEDDSQKRMLMKSKWGTGCCVYNNNNCYYLLLL